jgi:hypothetical protein
MREIVRSIVDMFFIAVGPLVALLASISVSAMCSVS